MFNWFAAKKANNLAAELQELNGRLQEMEKKMEQISARPWNMNIEHVHIDQPVLENLNFRLDSLDIKELSGSLNLGNNFGTRSEDAASARAGKSAGRPSPKADNPSASGNSTLKTTSSGFTFKR